MFTSRYLRETGYFDRRHIDRRFRDAVFLGLGAHPGSERFIDTSAYCNHGTLQQAPTWEWMQGINRWGLRFSVSHAVNCGNQSAFSATSQVTVAAWVDTTTFAVTTTVAGKWETGGATNNSYLLYGSGSVRFILQQSNTVIREVTATSPSNGMHHIVGMADGEDLSIYIDGLLVSALVSYDGTISVSTANFEVGRFNGNFPMVGLIADPLIFSRALSHAEIALLANPAFQLVRPWRQLWPRVPDPVIIPVDSWTAPDRRTDWAAQQRRTDVAAKDRATDWTGSKR